MPGPILSDEEIFFALEENDADENNSVSYEESEHENDSEEEDHTSENSDVGDVFDYSDEEQDQEMEPSISTVTHPLPKDGTNWFCNAQYTGRVPAHNKIKGMVNKVMLPPGRVIEDPLDSFRLYITEKIVSDIVKYTNIEATRTYELKNYKTQWKYVDSIEIEAFLDYFWLLVT